MSPADSEDLSGIVVRSDRDFVVLRSPDTAEHCASYEELGRFPTRKQARAFLEATLGISS
jgi:hypothetical protein